MCTRVFLTQGADMPSHTCLTRHAYESTYARWKRVNVLRVDPPPLPRYNGPTEPVCTVGLRGNWGRNTKPTRCPVEISLTIPANAPRAEKRHSFHALARRSGPTYR